MQTIGIDALGITIVGAIFVATLLLFDVPTGILADRWSRKNCLILSALLLALSSFVLGRSHGLSLYIVGSVLYGLNFVLYQGTIQAITYDTLYAEGRQDSYRKVWGRLYSFTLTGILVGSVLSGFIANHFSLRDTYFFTIVPSLLSVLILFWLVEPPSHKEAVDEHFISHAKKAIKQILSSRLLIDLSLLLMIASLLSNFQNEYIQLYFLALGLAPIALGVLNAAFAGAAVIGQLAAGWLPKRVDRFLPILVATYAGFSLWHSKWGLVVFLISVVVRNIIENQTEAEIQDNIKSSVRATTISVVNFASNAITIPLSILFGWVVRDYGAFRGFQMVALIGAIYLIYEVIFSPNKLLAEEKRGWL